MGWGSKFSESLNFEGENKMQLFDTDIRLNPRGDLLVTLFSSASFMALGIASALTLFSTAAFAGTPSCPAVIQNQTLGCTTQSITIAEVTVTSGQNSNCLAGQTIMLDLDILFESNKNTTVFDVGVWFAQDGLAIDSPTGAMDCISKPISFDIIGEPPDDETQVIRSRGQKASTSSILLEV